MGVSEIVDYALQHRGDDPLKMLLKGSIPPSLSRQKVAEQMEGMAMASAKWPWLAENDRIAYPCRLSREQSSSETAARYKADIIGIGDSVADLTGGMGIDSLMFAYRASHVDYVEQDRDLCDIMLHNSKVLELGNVSCHQAECRAWLREADRRFDWIYIDPARRDAQGRKLVSLADCQPNVLEMIPLLQSKAENLMLKCSPMIDLQDSISRLGIVGQVHIVAVGHECKEVLFCGRLSVEDPYAPVTVKCVDIWNGGVWHNEFLFHRSAPVKYAATMMSYLYEPNASLMKGAPWGEIGEWYGVEKLDRNTHLYTSARLVHDFPGRAFEVVGEVKLNRKAVRAAVEEANLLVRNYPADVATLRKQLGVAEGGQTFIVATTVKGEKKGFLCRKANGRMKN